MTIQLNYINRAIWLFGPKDCLRKPVPNIISALVKIGIMSLPQKMLINENCTSVVEITTMAGY